MTGREVPDAAAAPLRCAECGTEIAPTLASCPSCGRLVHGDELRRLAAEAEGASAAGDLSASLAAWRRALELLPPNSEQARIIGGKVAVLGRRLDGDRPSSRPAPSAAPKWIAAWGAAGLLLWKMKFVVGFLLTKAKFLLLGLSKAGTLFSMLLSLGVYWSLWGWKFALGLVVSLYIHEMGHVWVLRKYGIRAGAPMFVPGLGAFVRLKQRLATAREEARVGLAGPNWGLGAALVCGIVYAATGSPFWGAIARVGAWLNLFNLLPFLGLDGDRAFRAMSRPQKGIVIGILAAAWLLSGEGLLVLLALGAGFHLLKRSAPDRDGIAFGNYAALVVVLTALTLLDPKVL